MKIKFFITGGTIDKVYFDARSQYQVGSPQVHEIVSAANVAFDYEIVALHPLNPELICFFLTIS